MRTSDPLPPKSVPELDLRIERVRPSAGLRRVRVTGELDLTTAPRLRRVLLDEIDLLARVRTSRASCLELDLSLVDFCSAAGLSVLLEARQRAAGAGVGFTLGRPSAAVGRVLVFGGLGCAPDTVAPVSPPRA